MRTFVAETTIDRSAEEIWTYASDIPKHPEWMSASRATMVSGDATQVGARAIERLEVGPIKRDIELEVVEAVPGRRLLWRSVDSGGMSLEVELTLEANGPTSTRATYRGTYELRGRMRLLAPIMAMEGSSGIKRELGQLKARVEAQPVRASAASAASAATAATAEA